MEDERGTDVRLLDRVLRGNELTAAWSAAATTENYSVASLALMKDCIASLTSCCCGLAEAFLEITNASSRTAPSRRQRCDVGHVVIIEPVDVVHDARLYGSAVFWFSMNP